MSNRTRDADRRTDRNRDGSHRWKGRRVTGPGWTKNFLDMPLAGLLDFSGLGKALWKRQITSPWHSKTLMLCREFWKEVASSLTW